MIFASLGLAASKDQKAILLTVSQQSFLLKLSASTVVILIGRPNKPRRQGITVSNTLGNIFVRHGNLLLI